MSLNARYDAIARCNRCGFCQVSCPVFRATGRETGVARGRLALLRGLIEGRIPWTEELREPLFNCLCCGACTANCFSAVETADLLAEARAEYLEAAGRGPWHRLLFRHLLPNPRRLRLATRAVALGKRQGLSKLAGALGMLRMFGRDAGRAQDIVDRFPPRAYRDAGHPTEFEGQGKEGRIGYFLGCGVDIMCPEAAAATVRLLRRRATTVTVLDNCCCGLPAETYGDRTARRRLAEQNLARFDPEAFDIVATDCSSCAAYLKTYPRLFPAADPCRPRAEALAGRVRDVLELASSPSFSPSASSSAKRIVATYHDPCHASRGQGLSAEPRAILRSLPGYEYRELPEADWCCGGAGSYALEHYDLAMQVLDRKMANVEKTGAELLVTSCPACIIQLRYGIRRRGLAVRVRHISEVADPGLGGEWGDPAGSNRRAPG